MNSKNLISGGSKYAVLLRWHLPRHNFSIIIAANAKSLGTNLLPGKDRT
jgi:hypothetical protein